MNNLIRFFSLLTLIYLSSPVLSQSSNDLDISQLEFTCKEIVDKKTGNKYPSTVVWMPLKKHFVTVFFWKDTHLVSVGYTPIKRCNIVSDKLNKFSITGKLNVINGEYNGEKVVCVISRRGEKCNSENQLFQLKPTDNPDKVLLHLMNILDQEYSIPLYQTSGKQIYINIKDFLLSAPESKLE